MVPNVPCSGQCGLLPVRFGGLPRPVQNSVINLIDAAIVCGSHGGLVRERPGVSEPVSTLLAFNWESHGYHLKGTSRVLKTARDLLGTRAMLDGEETLPCAV